MRTTGTYTLLFVVLIASISSTRADAQDLPVEVRPDKLGMYRDFKGAWASKGTGQAGGEDFAFEETWTVTELFDGKLIQVRIEGTTDAGDDYASLWLCTYDPRLEGYAGWVHTSSGVHAKMKGTWSDKDKTMTWTLAYPGDHAVKVRIVEDFTDPEKIKVSHTVKRKDGGLVISTRHDPVRIDQPKKALQKTLELDEKLGMLKPYIGQWQSEISGKATDLIPEPYTCVSDWKGSVDLAGTMFRFTGTVTRESGDTFDYIWLYAFDQREDSYVVFYHESTPFNMKQYVAWDEKSRDFIYAIDPREKLALTVHGYMRLDDENTMTGNIKLVRNDGLTWINESLVANPVKE